jgi:HD-GYP domain-containing protein (c-di-GMP phosphodiesterase class II)
MSTPHHLRLAELVVALSLATDIGSGVPMETMLATCLVSLRLGEALGLSDEEMYETYYLALLRHAGCTAESLRTAELSGNDKIAVTREFFKMNPTQPMQMMGVMWRSVVNPTRSAVERVGLLMRLFSELPMVVVAQCEVAQQIAARLGFGERIQSGLLQFPERWDGKGFPQKLKGEAILRPVRIAQVAQEGVVLTQFFGLDAAVHAVRERAGVTLDPKIAETFCERAAQILQISPSVREDVLALEPGARPILLAEQMETATRTLADFTDLQTPFTTNHSTTVAARAESAARICHLSDAEVTLVRQAGYLHDIGWVSVSAGIWGKPGPLSQTEWEQVRLHPYYAQRILAQSPALAELGALASTHHERLDGSGYYRNLPATMLTPTMRLVAVAEMY